MKLLTDYSVQELEAELDRRQLPQPLSQPDTRELKALVIRHVAGERIKDCNHYIYEAAVEAIYGRDIWDFLRDRKTGKLSYAGNCTNL